MARCAIGGVLIRPCADILTFSIQVGLPVCGLATTVSGLTVQAIEHTMASIKWGVLNDVSRYE